MEQFNCIIAEIDSNQTEHAVLIHENYNLNTKLKKLEKSTKLIENSLKNVEKDIMSIRNTLNANKTEILNIENDLNNKVYFIRFSNSLVRSFFNIINTRRLQMEISSNLDKQEIKAISFMFDRLNKIESNLLKEYNEFLTICGLQKNNESVKFDSYIKKEVLEIFK